MIDMQKLRQEIAVYQPDCAQETADKALLINYLDTHENCLLRSNPIAHYSASAWIVNPKRDKVLMIYHNIYQSFAWTGGHADGDADLKAVAEREAKEETGLTNLRLLIPGIFSLECMTVDGHWKRGEYVSSHLHLNVTYLFEADDTESLQIKADENSAVRWIDVEHLEAAVSEVWVYQNIYKKLSDKVKRLEKSNGYQLSRG